jgi:hypothetical protein
MESGKATGQTAHQGVETITTTEGPMDFVKNTRKTAQSDGENTTSMEVNKDFGHGIIRTV